MYRDRDREAAPGRRRLACGRPKKAGQDSLPGPLEYGPLPPGPAPTGGYPHFESPQARQVRQPSIITTAAVLHLVQSCAPWG